MRASQILEAYDKYLGDKCSRSTYYKRIRRGIPFIEALKPVEKKVRHPNQVINTKKFKAEMEWYHQQPGEKSTRQRFYQRLYSGYTKEEAIKPEFGVHKSSKPISYKQGYVRQPTPMKKDNSDYFEIKIKYSIEEANVIRKEYARLIDDLEYKWRISDDPIEAKNIVDKLEKLKIEYKTFCLINY